MGTVNATITRQGKNQVRFQWTLTQNADGAPVGKQWADFVDRSVQVKGSNYDSATVVWQGSNDGTNYQTLTDPQGNAISRTSDSTMEQVTEISLLQRPFSSGGGASQNVVVTLLARRQRSGKEA